MHILHTFILALFEGKLLLINNLFSHDNLNHNDKKLFKSRYCNKIILCNLRRYKIIDGNEKILVLC